MGPSGYEVGFVSSAHTDEQLRQAATVMIEALEKALGS
jgi:glutamate-1-semialdehyde aminotransferase